MYPDECAGPPWHGRRCWREANASVRHIFQRHRGRLDLLTRTAGHIRAGLEELDLLYRDLCPETCTFCPEPCCISADIWFDLKDLLFLHAAGLPVPAQSPKEQNHMPCSFLGPGGCLLARTSRPWICTWYLCPTQKLRLIKENPGRLYRIEELTGKIRGLRGKMEENFIKLAVSGVFKDSKQELIPTVFPVHC